MYRCGISTLRPTVTNITSSSPSVSAFPSDFSSLLPTKSQIPSRTLIPSIVPTKSPPVACWMSGNHGISFRLMGGVIYFSAYFDVNICVGQFTEQLIQYGVKCMNMNLSSPSSGYRYLSPHSVLTQLDRG